MRTYYKLYFLDNVWYDYRNSIPGFGHPTEIEKTAAAYYFQTRRKSNFVQTVNSIYSQYWGSTPDPSIPVSGLINGFALLQTIYDIDVYKLHPPD